MKQSKSILHLIPALLLMVLAINMSAQCDSWMDSPMKDDAENAHTIYRQLIKSKEYTEAFSHWEKAYAIAPAADGQRDFHYTDGILLYLEKWKVETDDTKKKEYVDKMLGLQAQAVECLKSGAIKLKCDGQEDCYTKRIGYLQGRLAYDMFYTLNTPYSKTLEQVKGAVDNGGNDTEYIVFVPYASIAVYNFGKGKMTKEEVRTIYEKLNTIADYNIANNTAQASGYTQAKASMNGTFAPIERDIFDCEFFKAKLRPDYDAAPEDPTVIKKIIAVLKGQGCTPGDPFYDELNTKWKKYASAENAKIQAEFEQNNPAIMAKKLYDSGDFNGAANKYQEAINAETDASRKAGYTFSLASIQFRKLKKYSTARQTARDAAKLRPNWGRPFVLIGDMYGSTARSCGDSWNQRLAILAAMDKYRHAKSIDPSTADEVNTRLSKYRSSMPAQDEGFMRGTKAGDKAKVGCWIGETVTVRFN